MSERLSLFFSYSSRDESLREELETHLSVLRREGVIAPWSFRRIVPGDDWEEVIDEKLSSADIILLLITAQFLNSDYCWGVELATALRRHDAGEASVIPIILRDCDWKTQRFARLQALPAGAKPVTRFRPRDAGWTDVVLGIRRAAEARNHRATRANLSNRVEPPKARTDPQGPTETAPRKRAKRPARTTPLERSTVEKAKVSEPSGTVQPLRYEMHVGSAAEAALAHTADRIIKPSSPTPEEELRDRILSTVRSYWAQGRAPTQATIISVLARNAMARDDIAREIRHLIRSGLLIATAQEISTFSPILRVR